MSKILIVEDDEKIAQLEADCRCNPWTGAWS